MEILSIRVGESKRQYVVMTTKMGLLQNKASCFVQDAQYVRIFESSLIENDVRLIFQADTDYV